LSQSQEFIVKKEKQESVSILKELFDGFSYKILLSTLDEPKSVFQICEENDVPISSTYKKIRKLKESGLLFIDKIVISERGKKIVFYRSKVRSIELTLDKQQVTLQLKK
jgi:hypothetical protein